MADRVRARRRAPWVPQGATDLALRRVSLGLAQADLAECLERSVKFVSRLERGERCLVTEEDIVVLSRVLKLSVEEIGRLLAHAREIPAPPYGGEHGDCRAQ